LNVNYKKRAFVFTGLVNTEDLYEKYFEYNKEIFDIKHCHSTGGINACRVWQKR
jgi:hypothetical protein